MARKRMLDSEIWRDKKVIRLSNDGFILWIAIISMADDEGIFEYDADAWFYEIARKELTTSKISAAMNEIIEQGMVVMYGEGYGFIPAWYKHQTLSHPTPSKNRRPPKEVLDRYPEYMAGWIKTFTTYKKDEKGGKIIITPSYPYPEPSSNIPETSGVIPENSGKLQKTPGSINKVSLVESSINQFSNIVPQAAKMASTSVTIVEDQNQLYGTIKSIFEKVNGNFTNYAKEGAAIKRIIKLTNGDREAIEMMITTFFRLRQSASSFWSGQPFTPSALAASGIWDRVKEEAKKQIAEQSEDETFARFEAEDRAREAREKEGIL